MQPDTIFEGQKLPEDFESNSWEVLRVGITAIMTGQEPSTCLEVLYRVRLSELFHPHHYLLDMREYG